MKACPVAMEAHRGAVEAHSGAMEAHPCVMEANSGGICDKKSLPAHTVCAVTTR
jgi:hypothetical protein